jgi:CBS domain-containing protein
MMAKQPHFKLVAEIKGTNPIRFRHDATGLSVALELLSTHIHGAPVVDEKGRFIGFVSEFDLLKALEVGKDLNTVTAEEIMIRNLLSVTESTPIQDAVKLMEKMHLHSLPVVDEKNVVTKTVTRHDLLRAWVGIGIGVETGSSSAVLA